ncbi:hypothetical protein KPP23_055 [Pseudomonas phage KPP23]|nr:hypothetical protein KPP23_055 [Pseudomonas phage KPP23]
MNARDLLNLIEDLPVAQLGTTMDTVGRVCFEALDNAAHTDGVKVHEEGSNRYTDDFIDNWLRSVETVLACCDFVTEDAAKWYIAHGVKF